MTTTQELTVLKLQIVASVLMGADYFLMDTIREKLNGFIRSYAEGVASSADNDMKARFELLRSNLWHLLTYVAGLILAYLLFRLGGWLAQTQQVELAILALLLTIVLFGICVSQIFSLITHTLALTPVYLLIKAMTIFVSKSPKGALAALGMVFLFISFGVRYIYINGA